ncbi:MAG: Ig-like domain-containing protein [Gemmatimonadales bacterium]
MALRRLAPIILAATAAASTPARAQTASELQVTPETMTLGVGQRQTIFAAAYDRQGNLLQAAKFTFWSSDTLVAKVGPDGTVVGVSPGLAKVEARVPGRRASLAVLITGSERGEESGRGAAPPGSVLTLDPGSLVLLPGESMPIAPQGLKEDGTPAAVGKVSWKSLKPEVASVDSNGVVVAIAAGKSIIQAATSSGLMATAPVEVAPADVALSEGRLVLAPDDADTLRVLVPSQGGREIHGAVRWTSADSAVASVDSTGIVTARHPGQTEIVVAGFGQERRAPVLVHPIPQSLVVSPRQTPGAVLIPVQGIRKFTAHAEAADSTPIPEARIVWEVGDTSIVSRDSSKSTVTAKAAGVTTLSARLRGFEPVVWNLQVVPGVLGLDRSRVGLAPGDRATLGARLLDDQGKTAGPTGSLEWASDKPAVATVSPTGEIAGVSPGHTTVIAAAPWGGKAGAEVFVTSDLLVASNRGGAPGIYQMRSAGPDSLVPLLADSAANVQAVPSPDRTRIALSSNRGGGFDLWVMDADGRNLRRLTTDIGTEGEPAWTPDGARIIYTASPKTGLPQLASIRVDGTDNRALTTAGGNRSADVSPDGSTIAFVSTRDGNSKIYLMALDGSGQRRLTKGSDREANPRYLPNGDLIFTTEKGGGSRLQRLASGTLQPVTVLETNQPVLSLDVSRDGNRLAYTAGKLAEGGKGKTKIALVLQPLAAGSVPAPVPIRPGEQILSVSF